MIKVKNIQNVLDIWCGQEIGSNEEYIIQDVELLKWQTDDKVLTDIPTKLVVGDDTQYFTSVSDQIDWLKQHKLSLDATTQQNIVATKIVVCSSYSEWKNYVENKKILIHYNDVGDHYCLVSFDGIYFRYDYKLYKTDTESISDFNANYKDNIHVNNSQEKHDPLKYSTGKQYSPVGSAVECQLADENGPSTTTLSFQFDHDIKFCGVTAMVDSSKGDHVECKIWHPTYEQYVLTFGETLYLHPNVVKYDYQGGDTIVKTVEAGLRLDFIYTNVSTTHSPYFVIHLKKWENS